MDKATSAMVASLSDQNSNGSTANDYMVAPSLSNRLASY